MSDSSMSGAAADIRPARSMRCGARAAAGRTSWSRDAAAHLAERIAAVNRRIRAGARPFLKIGKLRRTAKRRGTLDPDRTAGRKRRCAGCRRGELALRRCSFDLVTSVLALHAVNDLPGALIQIRRALKPDGLFVAALFGGETLCELRQAFAAGESEVSGGASPRVAPLRRRARSRRAAAARGLRSAGRRCGAHHGALSRVCRPGPRPARAGRNQRAGSSAAVASCAATCWRHRWRIMRRTHAEADGRLRATFDIVYLTGWRAAREPAEAARARSARTRLADALRARGMTRAAARALEAGRDLVETSSSACRSSNNAVRITTEIRLAISAYSIAVAPLIRAEKG